MLVTMIGFWMMLIEDSLSSNNQLMGEFLNFYTILEKSKWSSAPVLKFSNSLISMVWV